MEKPMAMQEIQLDPVYTEALTPDQFLAVYPARSEEIRTARVMPVRLGEPGFGMILVRWKRPVYASHLHPVRKDGRSSRREK